MNNLIRLTASGLSGNTVQDTRAGRREFNTEVIHMEQALSTQIIAAMPTYRRTASPSLSTTTAVLVFKAHEGLTAGNECADAMKRPFGRGGPPLG